MRSRPKAYVSVCQRMTTTPKGISQAANQERRPRWTRRTSHHKDPRPTRNAIAVPRARIEVEVPPDSPENEFLAFQRRENQHTPPSEL